MAGTKFLCNKRGLQSHSNYSGMKKYVDHTKDNHIIIDSYKKSRARPMKTLLSQEMSKEIKLKRKQSNVVARLMGLDEPPPTNKSDINNGKKFGNHVNSSRPTLAKSLKNAREDEDDCFYNSMQNESDLDPRYEYERKMALVRGKFVEAKRLATNGNLLQSREFQNALDILNSNTDLFLKFVEEPKSLLNVPTQMHKITLLKPSREVESESKKNEHSISQPTRIVVLKPTMPKLSSSWSSSSNSSISRDESFISSSLSNGYVGDRSSFDITENHLKFDDSEITTPISRHSFDTSNIYGSPISFSSFSRASESPDSSMIREAKKRLSERWSLVACDADNRTLVEELKSSSTLGEMLAVSEMKKEANTENHNVSSSRADDSHINEEDSFINCQPPSQLAKEASLSYENIGSKPKTGKSSLKGKFASLLFSRNKKGAKDKATVPNEAFKEESSNASSSAIHKSISFRDFLSLEKMNEPTSSDKTVMNQNQTSPTSVLDALFENNTLDSSKISNARLPLAPIKSVTCKFSFDDIDLDVSSLETLHLHVHDILTIAGIDDKGLDMIFSIWQSADSPLGLNLLNEFLDPKEENAKSRERRSNQRLVFDSVNAALIDIGKSCIGSLKKSKKIKKIEDEVLLILKDWFCFEDESKTCESNNGSVLVDTLLRKELARSEWNSEIDEISEEIGKLALDDLLAEALEDFNAEF